MEREQFGSRFGVLVALAGSAIGLGNLWRFPYMVKEYGGAAFILVYIVFVFVLCLPILMSEFMIGRRSRSNAFRAFDKLAPGTKWKWTGVLMVITPTIILSYYSVIGGWCLNYLVSPDKVLGEFISSTPAPLIGHSIFLLVTAIIVAKGVEKGIEKFGKIMMPVLFILVIIITLRSMTLNGAQEGINYLFNPDFSKITPEVCAAALGQAFFSLSIGVGTVLTYASYVNKSYNIARSSIATVTADLIFALIASCAIMPAVFAFGLETSEGPGLVFETLPFIFSKMPFGKLIALAFFFTLTMAALTSSISMFEVGVAYFSEEKKISRKKAAAIVFCIAWVTGVLCSLSFGSLSGIKLCGNTIFNFCDKLCSNFLMPLGGLLMVLFVGWKLKKNDVSDEFTNGGTLPRNARYFNLVYFLIRYLAPIAVLIIFITNLI